MGRSTEDKSVEFARCKNGSYEMDSRTLFRFFVPIVNLASTKTVGYVRIRSSDGNVDCVRCPSWLRSQPRRRPARPSSKFDLQTPHPARRHLRRSQFLPSHQGALATHQLSS